MESQSEAQVIDDPYKKKRLSVIQYDQPVIVQCINKSKQEHTGHNTPAQISMLGAIMVELVVGRISNTLALIAIQSMLESDPHF